MKILRKTKENITKNKNSENTSNRETTKLILVHYNVANNS